MSWNPASGSDGFTNYNYNYNYNYVLNTQNNATQQHSQYDDPQDAVSTVRQERVNNPAPAFSFVAPSQATIARPTGPRFMNEGQAHYQPSFHSPSSMAPVMDIDSYGFSQPSQSPFHRMSLSSDRLPNPGVEFPLTGNGLARDVFSSMKYPTSSTSSAQSFQQYFYSMTSVDDIHSANPSPASDTNWVARVRAEHDDSGYGRVQGTVSPMEYTTSLIGDVPWCGTTEHPSNRQREESQRPFQPDLFRHLPGNPYPQPLSPPRPVPLQSTRIPLPTFENQWGSPHQVQSAPNSSSRNIQPTVALKSSGRDPIGHHSLGWTLNEGTRESHQHNNSNLHRGELERQNYKCHWLPATGWRTSSEHDVAERNQFHAGHPSESRHEEYEPFHYPAQRDSATRRRQYDISNPPFDMQSQIRHLEPATATFPSYDKGPLPSSFSSTMELFSGPPSSSNLTAFQFEEDFRTNKSAKKVTLLKHVVPQVLFTDPMTLENRPQYDDETDEDSDSEEEEEEEESDEGEESDPEGAERRS